MPFDQRITSDVKLVLVTGNPGAWKSTVTKIVYGWQSEEWRMLSLDDYFYLAQQGPTYRRQLESVRGEFTHSRNDNEVHWRPEGQGPR